MNVIIEGIEYALFGEKVLRRPVEGEHEWEECPEEELPKAPANGHAIDFAGDVAAEFVYRAPRTAGG